MVKENFKVPGLYQKQPVSGNIGIRRGATQRMGVYCRFNAIYTVLYAGTVNLAET